MANGNIDPNRIQVDPNAANWNDLIKNSGLARPQPTVAQLDPSLVTGQGIDVNAARMGDVPQIDPSLFNLPKTQLPQVTVQDLSALLKGGPAIPQTVPQRFPQLTDLATARQGIAQELQDPAVRQKLMASIQAEVGDQGAAAKLGYIESVMNRSLARGTTLNQTISDTGYYPNSTLSKLGQQVSDTQAAELNGHIQTALTGSNITNFATGNESGKVRSGGAPITFNPGTGERFVLENQDTGWQQSLGRFAQANAPMQVAQAQGMTVADLMRQHGL